MLPLFVKRIPDWLWIGWFIFFFGGGIVVFLVLELTALLHTPPSDETGDDDTFSGYVRRKWTRVNKARRRVVFFTLLGFMMLIMWLIPHFLIESV